MISTCAMYALTNDTVVYAWFEDKYKLKFIISSWNFVIRLYSKM
jgi:hypothetical protein